MNPTDTRDFAEIRFDFILMSHIQACGDQLKRLPHEIIDASLTRPTGTTRQEIIESYCDMVEHLAELLAPYADEQFKPETNRPEDAPEIFIFAKRNFGRCIQLCNRKGLLLEKFKAITSAEAEPEGV